ncbi:MAG: 4-alpha-glucanotransferase [Ignavibacteriae bacterium]|nr:4-alpha-glucanotransferase [Ignavibacteriota bacterium]
MKFERSAGILLHPTSLPGNFGIGDLGPNAFYFVDFLEACGQRLWQVLPLGPTGYGDSPYQCFSAFAGNPLLISPEKLLTQKLLSVDDLQLAPLPNPTHVDFGKVIETKKMILEKAFQRFQISSNVVMKKEFDSFCESNNFWLEDFALFMTIKEANGGKHWNTWEKEIIHRDAQTLEAFSARLHVQVSKHKFIQFLFFQQWHELKTYANNKNIKIIGDLPIFIAYDSADVWANKHLFDMDEDGVLLTKAGVPPDYFSPTGQLWGNPLYRWDVMKKDDFAWWRFRIQHLLESVDIIRIDHFRGFEAFWEIPGDAETAEKGKWVNAPGKKFFTTLQHHLGTLPILAEDLGVITKPVVELRDHFGFPGMKILQFAFGSGMEHKFLPHNFLPNCVVYTGSHDNDTTRGYFEKAKNEANDIYSFTQRYINYYRENLTFELIRLAHSSVADIVIIPMQDILNLGAEARMNFPGKLGGNWTWRFTWEQVKPNLASKLKELTELYERPPKPKPHEQTEISL